MEEQEQEALRLSKLMAQLQYNEHFIAWRDEIVIPNIEALRAELANSDELSSEILRANLKHVQSLEYFFKNIFDQANQVIIDNNNRDNPK